MPKFWVGVSGYSYPSWKGTFYPVDLPSNKFLEFYAKRFRTVEINSSFYHLPTRKMLEAWSRSVPDDFRFSFKANRQITHIKKLKSIERELDAFFHVKDYLGDKLGVLLFQLPPYMRRDDSTLDKFLQLLPSDVCACVEFRHQSWIVEDLYSLLSKREVALCVVEGEGLEPVLKRTGRVGYARLRKNQYNESELAKWASALVSQFGRVSDVYVYFKHDEKGIATEYASQFSQRLS